MNILSCFDGISAGRLALQRAGIKVETYYRSEVDKFANKVAMHHFTNDVQLGDVTKWREWNIDWSSIDMLIGGSPCQGFSFAGKQAGTKAILDGEEVLVTDRETYLSLKDQGAEFLSQSYLFWEYVLILDHIKLHNPNVKFLLENVKMKKELLQMIDDAMGVKSVVINSALLSAQNRVRHYWCNWEVKQPEDKGILLKDILDYSIDVALTDGELKYMNGLRDGKPRIETRSKNPETDEKYFTVTSNFCKGVPYGVVGIFVDRDKSHCLDASYYKGGNPKSYFEKHRRQLVFGGAIRGRYNEEGKAVQQLECNNQEKTNCLTTVQKDNVIICGDLKYRKLTPTECARLQTFPDGWCESVVSNSQSYKAYGNSWTVDVIAHIFKEMKNESI